MDTAETAEPNAFETTESRIINQITLDCLLNKDQYSKYLNSAVHKTVESSKRDRKFYKRRILQITKDMLSAIDTMDTTTDMMFAFDNFSKTCISYFKMMDKTDILQTDYNDDVDETEKEVLEPPPPMSLEEEAKSLLRNVKINTITMDQFVKRTSTAQPTQLITFKREINLKDPDLRNKGIRKKKNSDTMYAEDDGKIKTDEE
jgi:hypothetical protein